MNIESTKTNFFGIDLTRVIMAIAVVIIHSAYYSSNRVSLSNSLFSSFLDFAVPFFFIASGFFLSRKLNSNKQAKTAILWDFFKKNLKMYIIWTIIYLPLSIYGLYIEDNLNFYGASIFIKNTLIKGENYYSWPLWYLLSVVFSAAIFLIWNRLNWGKISLLTFAFIVFLLHIYLFRYFIETIDINILQFVYNNSFASSRILYGLLFLTLGMLGSKFFDIINLYAGSIGFAICVYLNTLDNVFLTEFAVVVGSVFLFSVVKRIVYRNNELSAKMRKFSAVTFFSHMYFYFLFRQFFQNLSDNGLMEVVFTVLMSLILTIIVLKTENSFKFFKVIF